MKTRQTFDLKWGPNVWVWDSAWLPAVVVAYAADLVRVRLSHGITFNVGVEKLAVRDAKCVGKDMPSSCWRDAEENYAQSDLKTPHTRIFLAQS